MTEVTGQFQSLSQEVMVYIRELRRRGLGGVATILENIQEKEKEKLQLVSMCHVTVASRLDSKLMFPTHFWIQTAKWQENSCKNRQKEEEDEEEEDDFGASEHQKRELRKQ